MLGCVSFMALISYSDRRACATGRERGADETEPCRRSIRRSGRSPGSCIPPRRQATRFRVVPASAPLVLLKRVRSGGPRHTPQLAGLRARLLLLDNVPYAAEVRRDIDL